MSNNSTVELIKIPAPKGYNAKHVWAIVKDGKQYGEIVPDMGRDGTIGYTVYTAAGVEHYSLSAGGSSHCRITLAAALSACKQAARNMVRWEEEAAAEAAAPAPAPAASFVTEQERIEVRDAATAAWAEASDASDLYCRACAVELAMKELGLKCRTNGNWGASCFVTVYLTDHLGNLLTLEWDPMQDGFEIDEEPPAHLMSDRTAGDWVSPPTRQDQLEGRG